MPTAVVTGSNSGIGHAFAEILIREAYEVHALDKTVGGKMKSLGCQTHQRDLSSKDSIRALAKNFKGKRLDLTLNIAGIMAPHEQDSLENTTPDILLHTIGPLLLTQALLPSLLLSPHPRIGLTSSRVGSTVDNSSGGSYAYRASKAALNSIGKREHGDGSEGEGSAGHADASRICQERVGYRWEDVSDEGGGGEAVEGLQGKGDRGDWEVWASRGDGVGLVERSRVLPKIIKALVR